MRIVLYAEGAGELAAAGNSHTSHIIPEDDLGAAHLLVRRCLAEGGPLRTEAIRFQGPLRAPRARVARGSDLLDRNTLRRLLTWMKPELEPDLVVVLVDEDGERGRKQMMEDFVSDLLPDKKVVAVAVREFESWLIADEDAAGEASGTSFDRTPDIEPMEPRKARSIWSGWMAGRDERAVKRTVACTSSLDLLANRCRAFDDFRSDLRRMLQKITTPVPEPSTTR
jgi:hypothetical protein